MGLGLSNSIQGIWGYIFHSNSAFVKALPNYIVKETNYYLYIHYTVQYTQYSSYHLYMSSVNLKKAKEKDLYEKLFCDFKVGCF